MLKTKEGNTAMQLYDLLEEKELDIQITFRKKFTTLFDLTYLLVDIQAVVNGFCDMVQEISRQRPDDEIYIKNEISEKNQPATGRQQTEPIMGSVKIIYSFIISQREV